LCLSTSGVRACAGQRHRGTHPWCLCPRVEHSRGGQTLDFLLSRHILKHMAIADSEVPPSRRVSLFRNGKNQAVRIPRAFELPTKEAKLTKDGDRLIIEPVPSQASLLDVLAKLPRLEERIPDVDAGLPELDDVEL